MRAVPTDIKWHPGLPVFAAEKFLRAVSDGYGWLGGVDEAGKLRCVLPYTIVRKSIFRMVRFRVETIPLEHGISIDEERAFLNSCIAHFRSQGAHVIIPATTNTIFRTYPDGAKVAPYGSFIIDLTQPEEALWRNVGRITRQNINTARKDGLVIRSGPQYADAAFPLIEETFKRSDLPFMGLESFRKFVAGLGDNALVMVADHQGEAHSFVVFAYSQCCAYAVYAGNKARQHQGANKLLYWEAMRHFRSLGIPKFDFVGARINPEKGSKQEALNQFKQRFGANLIQGYLWKYSLRPVGALVYSLAVKWSRGGDIVDRECHKLQQLAALAPALAVPTTSS